MSSQDHNQPTSPLLGDSVYAPVVIEFQTWCVGENEVPLHVPARTRLHVKLSRSATQGCGSHLTPPSDPGWL
jgi:hypothetical protein